MMNMKLKASALMGVTNKEASVLGSEIKNVNYRFNNHVVRGHVVNLEHDASECTFITLTGKIFVLPFTEVTIEEQEFNIWDKPQTTTSFFGEIIMILKAKAHQTKGNIINFNHREKECTFVTADGTIKVVPFENILIMENIEEQEFKIWD